MPEVELENIPPLTDGQQSLLDFHSVINVLQVLILEIRLLGLNVADDEAHLARSLAICDGLLASVHQRTEGLKATAELERHQATILEEIASVVPPAQLHSPEIRETRENIAAVFAIMHVRARELLARISAPERWESFDPDLLHNNFVAVFAAIEKVSRGRYRILLNPDRHDHPDTYHVDFRIEVAPGTSASMPPVVQDVMRDLLANARKFTPAGGRITAVLSIDDESLRFFVRDTGCGIPPAEITAVIAFGARASNVAQVRSLGGGFGLTKAFFVTKQLGGRFWIDSEIGVGTEVRLWLPRPAAECSAPVLCAG